MEFFLLLSTKNVETTLERVKKYTHNDSFKEIYAHMNINYVKSPSFPCQSTFDLTPGKHKITGIPSIGNIQGAPRVLNFTITK